MLKTNKGYRRGYPVAILAGLENDKAVLWRVFSHVVKLEKTIFVEGNRNDSKVLYNFHESIVNTLRPTLKEGLRAVMLVAPARTNFSQKFVEHINNHHSWLVQGQNKIVLSPMTGSASTLPEITALVRTCAFQNLISEAVSEETDNLLPILEKRLNATTQKALVLYSLAEIEDLVFSNKTGIPQPEYLLLTDRFLARSHQKGRLHRLMQIAQNRKIKMRIVDAESKAGVRLEQFGGIVCLVQIS